MKTDMTLAYTGPWEMKVKDLLGVTPPITGMINVIVGVQIIKIDAIKSENCLVLICWILSEGK